MKFYTRINKHTCFILPTIAIGTEAGVPFMEFGWLIFAIGIGEQA